MQYRNDKYGNPISILGFGCMRFPQTLGKIDMAATEELLLHAVESGVNYFDPFVSIGIRFLRAEVWQGIPFRGL